MKAFIEDHPDYPTKKEYWDSVKAKGIRQMENLEQWSMPTL